MNDLTSASYLISVINSATPVDMVDKLKQSRVSSFRQLDECLKKIGVERDEQMIRNNIYIAPLDWFYIEPGFNLREIDDAHAESFAKAYELGQYVPPVVAELKLVDGIPRLVLRDGHHRLVGGYKAKMRGINLPGLQAVEFRGNLNDAVVMMIKTSEGKPLLPLQRAEGYKRLSGQNWSNHQIAEQLGCSTQNVDRLLLANAEESVKQLVREEKVSATVTIDVLMELRGTDQDPYQRLVAMVEQAHAAGRSRATGKEAAQALGKFKVTPKEAKATFGALSHLAGPLRERMQAGDEEVQLDLRLDSKSAELLLKLLEKYESTQQASA